VTSLRTAAAAALAAVLLTVTSALPGAAAEASAATPQTFAGQAFDTCSAPDLTLLQAWRTTSPYRAVGIYIGGSNRACAQPQLNHAWTRAANAQGWKLLPLYVGSQAPCVRNPRITPDRRIDPKRVLTQAQQQGRDAVNAARALGIGPGSPIYLDMESYPRGSGACTLAVLRFTAAWTQALHAAGYLSGFYSSADSGIADLAAAALEPASRRSAGSYPDAVWYARWDARNDTSGYHALPSGGWAGHRRVHQYRGGITERYGGRAANIDRNAVDAPVALVR
jgi:hypothetical protein